MLRAQLRGYKSYAGVRHRGLCLNFLLDLKLLALLFVANGAPVIAKNVLKHRFSAPIDGGSRLPDGEPLLGNAKTIRGIVSSLLATAVAAPLVRLTWPLGLTVSAASMLGDVLSSFLKRRLKMPSSGQAPGLDQVPESLLPLLVCWLIVPVTLIDVAATVAAFAISEVLFSKVLFRLHIRDRPY